MNRKGFTLVELLAVIVILAIIALITIPIVLKTINNSEIEGEKQSIAGYARAIEDDVANYLMMNPGKSYNDYIAEFNKGNINIDYKGNKVECDDPISINDKGKLILGGCYVYKEGEQLTDEQIDKKNHYNYDGKNVNPIQNNNTSTSYDVYKVGDSITVAGEQYYVIEDSGITQDYVTALKANPLTVSEVNSYGQGHINNYTNYSNTVYDCDGYAGVAYYSSSNCGIVNDSHNVENCSTNHCGIVNDSRNIEGCSTNYNDSDIRYIVDNWANGKFKKQELKKINGFNARILSLDDLVQNLGYQSFNGICSSIFKNGNNTPNWVYSTNYWYWTMSPSDESSTEVWFINGQTNDLIGENVGLLDRNYVFDVGINRGNSGGLIRPVINVKKNKIQ